MKFESKYNFGDKPFKISLSTEKSFETCSFCGGNKNIIGQDLKSRMCPECMGRGGKTVYLDKKWNIVAQITIGDIKIRHRCKSIGQDPDSMFDNYGPQDEERKESYMCYETGIGSGSIHYVDTLWPTKEEAQTECDRRNLEMKSEDNN